MRKTISDVIAGLLPAMSPRPAAPAANGSPRGRRVRPVAVLPRSPATPLERFAVETLGREGAMAFDALVDRLAGLLYRDALRHGGWVIDIGFFGQNLFVPEVARDLEAGDGLLWDIEPPSQAR